MESKPITIFTHIPKTAGTSLNQIMLLEYKLKYMCICKSEISLQKQIHHSFFNKKKKIEIIISHSGHGIHKYLNNSENSYNYFTILRSPIERTISDYYFKQKRYSHNLSWEKFCRVQSNIMTRFLSGFELPEIWKKSSYDEHVLSTCFGSEEFLDRIPDNMLEVAKQNLKNYKIVGLTEKFDETLLLLKNFLGWRSVFHERKNVGVKKKSKPLPVDILRNIEKYNELDIELYEYAQKIFANNLAQQNDLFFQKLELMKNLNISAKAKLMIRKNNILVLLKRIHHRTLFEMGIY